MINKKKKSRKCPGKFCRCSSCFRFTRITEKDRPKRELDMKGQSEVGRSKEGSLELRP